MFALCLLEHRFRSIDKQNSMVIVFSCSTNSESSNSALEALKAAVENNVEAI